MQEQYPRWIVGRVREALADTPVVVVQGARQTGKSTLTAELAKESGATVVTLDDPEARLAAEADPESFIAGFGGGPVVLDEIQRAPQLILPIKAAVDRDRQPGRFLLTGSADLMRVPGAEDSLAGRAETIRLRPLSQGEVGRRQDDFVARFLAEPDLSGWSSSWSRERYVDAICAGGYPTALARNGERRRVWLADYVDRLMRGDLRDLTTASPARLRKVLALLAGAQTGELVPARIARDVGVAEGTARGDVQRLSDLYLVDSVPGWSRSRTRRVVARAKAHVADSGLAAMLSNLEADDLLSHLGVNHLGGLLEGFVSNELLRQSSWSSTRFDLSHYREAGGAEVDLLVELRGGKVLGLEVKASSTARPDHATGLMRLRDRLGDDFVAGVVLHLGERAWNMGERLWALPVAALWEL
ncbi:ATP-binding protein [Propioniciclava tarda]|uniref:ATP-binding protein n=1 Tax=Propioniciclava tarda TaxID=433330 RepID=A0A4Q9KJM8_PROTD|nr:ATP-binding protein [Propioniciclava tarda]TBT94365.1 ATP-binding protein [Propioniciclava tarda]SMO72529.1 hypothetical protein SAMN06266982_11451 [Propioniciclava tarda]HOA88089.1 ATP-binding protein [Propioniciclava tarda]HQA30980.1 ATP-binding protein [Propioniciclava tarda]HQD59956.1 ATP-binding protein [Propioniciclava tarda]